MKTPLFILVSLLIGGYSAAQLPGQLDTGYGDAGIVTIVFPGSSCSLGSIGVQSGNRVIASGNLYDIASSEDYLIATRLLEDGTSDLFGNLGTYQISDIGPTHKNTATWVLPDDKILLAGHYGASGHMYVMRLNPNGMPDPTFAVDGIYRNESLTFAVTGMVVVPAGSGYHILLSGFTLGNKPRLFKLDDTGQPVNAFGINGMYEHPLMDGMYTDLKVDTTAGVIYAAGNGSFELYAFVTKHDLVTGALIPSFGVNGSAVMNPFGDATKFFVRQLLFNPVDEQVVAFGFYIHTAGDVDICAFALHTVNGTLDPGFGVNGWSTLRIPVYDETIQCAIAQADGKYYFGGCATDASAEMDFMLGRLNPNGFLDLDFGSNGITITQLDMHDEILDLDFNSEQSRIYAGGTRLDLMTQEMVVASYHTGFLTPVPGWDPNDLHLFGLYPNPAGESVSILLPSFTNFHGDLVINDLFGRKCLRRKVTEAPGETITLDLTGLEAGIYLVCFGKENQSISRKLVVAK